FALWKPPRYFSALRFEWLLTDCLKQVGKHRGVLPIVESPRELVQVKRQIFLADLVIAADDAALEETPKSLNRVCVCRTDHVLACAVPDDAMVHILAQEPVASVFIGRNQADILGYGLANKPVQCRGIGVLDNFRDHHSL